MSEPTLAVQYFDTVAKLVLHAEDGTQFEIAKATPGANPGDPVTPTAANLPRAFLLTPDFAAAVKTGTIAFVDPSSFTTNEEALAVDVVRFLLNGPGLEMIAAGRVMLDGERALEKQRDAYNANHEEVKEAINDGNLLATGANHLVFAAEKLLDPKVEEAAVIAAQQALDAHTAQFAGQSNDAATLNAYYAQHKILETALETANAKLEASNAKREAEFGSIREALDEAAQVMSTLEVADIGAALTWKWPSP